MNYILQAIVALILFTSCGKTDPQPAPELGPGPGPAPRNITKNDIVGSYRIVKVEAISSGQRRDVTEEWFDMYAGDCSRDDMTQFKPDNSFVVVDGTVACDESTNDTGTWAIISNTALRLDADTATVEECTAATLRIVSPVYSSAQADIIFTYKRQ